MTVRKKESPDAELFFSKSHVIERGDYICM